MHVGNPGCTVRGIHANALVYAGYKILENECPFPSDKIAEVLLLEYSSLQNRHFKVLPLVSLRPHGYFEMKIQLGSCTIAFSR